VLNSIRIEHVVNVKSGIEVVKIIRTAARLSLREAKDLWDKSKFEPVQFESLALTAEDTKLLLEKYGCKVSIINISPTSREILESQARNLGGRIVWD
jgi:ribosomal protein L7/L12